MFNCVGIGSYKSWRSSWSGRGIRGALLLSSIVNLVTFILIRGPLILACVIIATAVTASTTSIAASSSASATLIGVRPVVKIATKPIQETILPLVSAVVERARLIPTSANVEGAVAIIELALTLIVVGAGVVSSTAIS